MKHLLYGLLLVVSNVLFAQEDSTTTLYRHGKSLATYEANFENLFKNVPRYLKNNDDLDLLSYEYKGTIKNANHARELLKKNFSHYPQWAVAETYPGYVSSAEGKRFVGDSEIKLMPAEIPSFIDIRKMINTIANEYVTSGDRIYLLRFVYNMETFEQYIFVRSDTKEVVTQGAVFGFNVRLSHFEKTGKNK